MEPEFKTLSRRSFIKQSSTAATMAALGSTIGHGVYAAGTDVLKIGLVGCGGRGTSAASQALQASDTPTVLWAMGDLFADQVEASHKLLSEGAEGRYDRDAFKSLSSQLKVPPERRFSGFDSFKQVIASDVDIVILATPPHFRPEHFEAAVQAGKHIFMEKPVAVDPVGIRRILEAAKISKQKNLSVVAGTQRRHQNHYREILKRVQDGAIGEIISGQCYWNMGPLWVEDSLKYWNTYKSGKWSDMEYQCRNWLFHVWLSGDHICEQHVHNIDIMHWGIGQNPVGVMGVGGRQERVQPQYGNGYDHFNVEFEFPNGVRISSMCRQQSGSSHKIAERLVGTKGQTYTDGSSGYIIGENAYEYKGDMGNPYVQEHTNLINSIVNGDGLNEAEQVAMSTISAIAGRMSAYTGRDLKWAWALHSSKLDLSPETYAFGDLPLDPPAIPGTTRLV